MAADSQVDDYAAPAPEEPPRGKVKRNLHLVIIVVFAVVAFPAIMWKAMRDQTKVEETAKDQKAAAAKETVSVPPSLAPIQSEIATQKKSAEDAAAQLAQEAKAQAAPGRERGGQPGPAVPPIPGSTLLPAPPAFMPASQVRDPAEVERRQRELEAEKEAVRIASSSILALAEESNAAGKTVSASAAPQDQMLAYTAALAAARQAATPNQGLDATKLASLLAEQPPKTTTKVEDDRDWVNKQGQAKRPPAVYSTPASSPHTVFQGTIIPAVLLSEVNSDLPGMLTAQVTQDVYDSIHGMTLLIPKGSRLVGTYNNDVRTGQERVMAAFNRIIFPSGASADIAGMGGADEIGRSGLAGDVDSHFWKQFGASFLVAGLAALVENAKTGSTTTVTTASGGTAVGNAAGQILVETTRNIQQRNARIPPTIHILSGYKFNVLVNKDLILPPRDTGATG